jgi:hypothetical protein
MSHEIKYLKEDEGVGSRKALRNYRRQVALHEKESQGIGGKAVYLSLEMHLQEFLSAHRFDQAQRLASMLAGESVTTRGKVSRPIYTVRELLYTKRDALLGPDFPGIGKGVIDQLSVIFKRYRLRLGMTPAELDNWERDEIPRLRKNNKTKKPKKYPAC